MSEKWLGDTESIILDGKSFVWTSGGFTFNGTWAVLYLTNQRLYVKDRILGLKLLDLSYDKIKSVRSDEKYLFVVGDVDGEDITLKIKLKDIDEMWESMIKARMK